jgi:hypothetical protein
MLAPVQKPPNVAARRLGGNCERRPQYLGIVVVWMPARRPLDRQRLRERNRFGD